MRGDINPPIVVTTSTRRRGRGENDLLQYRAGELTMYSRIIYYFGVHHNNNKVVVGEA